MSERQQDRKQMPIGATDMRNQAETDLRIGEEEHLRLFETMAQGVVYQAADGTIISANSTAEEILGLSLDQMQGKTSMDPLWQMIKEDGSVVPGAEHPAMIALQTGKKVGPLIRGVYHTLKQEHVWLSINATPLFKPGETKPYLVYATFDDHTERKRVEEALQARERFLATILQTTIDGFWVVNNQKRIIQVNDAYCAMSGYSREELLSMTINDLDVVEIPEETSARIKQIIENGSTLFKTCHRRKDGTIIPLEISVTYLPDNGGQLVCFCRDITERKQTEELLRKSAQENAFQSELLHKAPVIAAFHDKDQNIVWANQAYEEVTGVSLQNIAGKKCYSVWNLSGPCQGCPVLTAIAAGENSEAELTPHNQEQWPESQGYWLSKASPVRDEEGSIIGAIEVALDITARKKDENELLYLSNHDHLTGLYNRRYFEQELKRLNIQENLPLSIIMCDVNGLKLVNDSFGHDSGDMLLKKTAETIKKACREEDIIARIGGDEFVVLLLKTPAYESVKIANQIKELASKEMVANIELSISYGYDTKTTVKQSISETIANAENYMYRHKLYERSSIRSKTIDLIMNALIEKSNREAAHSNRVSSICQAIASKMNLDKDSVNQMKIAGLIHDIGKIGIDEKILNKPGRLTDNERIDVERHPEIGWRLLNSTNEFSKLAQFVLNHHEKWDGSGYPNGLKGEAIQLEARIIAVADSYDAMTSERSYRKALSNKEAIKELKRCSGTHFDPEIVNVFVDQVLPENSDLVSQGLRECDPLLFAVDKLVKDSRR